MDAAGWRGGAAATTLGAVGSRRGRHLTRVIRQLPVILGPRRRFLAGFLDRLLHGRHGLAGLAERLEPGMFFDRRRGRLRLHRLAAFRHRVPHRNEGQVLAFKHRSSLLDSRVRIGTVNFQAVAHGAGFRHDHLCRAGTRRRERRGRLFEPRQPALLLRRRLR